MELIRHSRVVPRSSDLVKVTCSGLRPYREFEAETRKNNKKKRLSSNVGPGSWVAFFGFVFGKLGKRQIDLGLIKEKILSLFACS